MVARLPQSLDTEHLEAHLVRPAPPLQRMQALEDLIGQLAFTDIHLADKLLCELEEILETGNYPEQEFRFHLWRGNVDNQLYNFEAATQHLELAIELAEQGSVPEILAEVYIDYAGICMNNREFSGAKAYLEKAEQLLRKYPNSLLRARVDCRWGFLYLNKDRNKGIAIEYLIEAARSISTHAQPLSYKDCYFLVLTYAGLADIYAQNEEYKKSIDQFHEAIKIAEATGVDSRLSWFYLHTGNAYLELEEYPTAEQYFKTCLEMEEDVNAYARASAYANLGFCRLAQGGQEEALALFDQADALFRDYSPDDWHNVSNLATWRAQAYADLGKNQLAKKYFLQAFDYASEEEDNKKLSNICKEFAAFYARIGNFEKAYEFQKQHSKYSEQFVQKVHEQKRWELEAKFNVEMERKEATMLRLEASKLQLKALRAQMNPHFMYNALNGIQNYITSDKRKSAAKYLAKFSMLMRKSLLYSDLETISLEKELDFLREYLFINKKLRFGDALNYEIQVDEEIEEDIIGVPTMIIQPYVENAIEHGLRTKKEGHLLIQLQLQDEDTILCVIEDDGIGLEASRAMQSQNPRYQNHRSRGTSITEKRLQLLHNAGDQDVFVDTKDRLDQEGGVIGTRVEIQIPVIDLHTHTGR